MYEANSTGVLRTQCLDRRIGDRDRLVSEIAAWERQRNAARDRAATKSLRQAGWTTLIVWECELRDRPKILSRLRRFLRP